MVWQLIAWAAVFAVCIVAEMISLGLTTIWFAGGALVAFITACFHVPVPVQIIIFAIVSLILLFTTRPFAKNYFNKQMQKTNVESLIGEYAVVIETIDNLHTTGHVKVGGMEWTARSKNNEIIPVDTIVKIEEVSGVKLIVSISQEINKQ